MGIKIRSIKVRKLKNGALLATYTIRIDGEAPVKGSSFIPKKLDGEAAWKVEGWLVRSIDESRKAAGLGDRRAIVLMEELHAKKAARRRKKASPSTPSTPSASGWHTVTADDPAVYGSHLLGLEGRRIRKSDLYR